MLKVPIYSNHWQGMFTVSSEVESDKCWVNRCSIRNSDEYSRTFTQNRRVYILKKAAYSKLRIKFLASQTRLEKSSVDRLHATGSVARNIHYKFEGRIRRIFGQSVRGYETRMNVYASCALSVSGDCCKQRIGCDNC